MCEISQDAIHDVFIKTKPDDTHMNNFFTIPSVHFEYLLGRLHNNVQSSRENSKRISTFCFLIAKSLPAITAAWNTKHSSLVSGKTIILLLEQYLSCDIAYALVPFLWVTNSTVIFKFLPGDLEIIHGKVVRLTNQRAGQCFALQHQISPPARVIITSLTEKWGEAGCRKELEIQQSIKGTTGRWLSGARTDAGIEQGRMGPCYVTALPHSPVSVCCGCLGWPIYLRDRFLNFIVSWTRNPPVLCVNQSRPIAVERSSFTHTSAYKQLLP